jgi:hypothetical protein
MKQLPKSLVICGLTWKVKENSKLDGARFSWHDQLIEVEKNTWGVQYACLFHEVAEIILVEMHLRYTVCKSEGGNESYLFSFNHAQFDFFAQELSGVTNQVFRRSK